MYRRSCTREIGIFSADRFEVMTGEGLVLVLGILGFRKKARSILHIEVYDNNSDLLYDLPDIFLVISMAREYHVRNFVLVPTIQVPKP